MGGQQACTRAGPVACRLGFQRTVPKCPAALVALGAPWAGTAAGAGLPKKPDPSALLLSDLLGLEKSWKEAHLQPSLLRLSSFPGNEHS